MADTRIFYNITVEEARKALRSDDVKGLSADEAKKRLEELGPNTLKEGAQRGPFAIFLEQFGNFIIWVLIGAALISGFLKEWVDSLAIIAIVILNAILGFVQEYRAEKSLAALKKLSSPTSKTIRDGKRLIIQSSELVSGDLVELEAGDNIPADCRAIWLTSNFSVQESSLTGESVPVLKTTMALAEKEVPITDRANMLYMGTSVLSGKGRALIAETSMRTELGRIAGMIQAVGREPTPLQKRLEKFGKWIVYLCFALVGIIFLLGVLRGGKIIDMFLTAVSLAVAAIPEGLPAVVTIALALGVRRMVKRNALIRKLPSVETLGCATVICSDKTGTLTKNEMTVRALYAAGRNFSVSGIGYETKGDILDGDAPVSLGNEQDLSKLLLCGVLCNGAELIQENGSCKVLGDPTEGAILVAAAKAGILKKDKEEEFIFEEEIPFDAERKRMTIIRRGTGNALTAFVKGAPDVLLNECVNIEENGGVRRLGDEDRKKILAANGELADKAMRVLGIGYRALGARPNAYEAGVIERELTFVGLVAMIDPPREEVKTAIEECKTAGIRTVMITGDHRNTAVAVARELGFFPKGSRALTGEELDRINDEELGRIVEEIPVYARVAPEHKLRIVRAWRGRGEVAAMTGDGVNDAPAVKEADIGVAMGITGTDVTKEVSDMVVTDDNFASIVAAVREGRGIYDNIKKFVHYLLSCNAGEVLVMFISSLAGWPAPLLPIHILWVNLVTDGAPALALGMDPVEPGVMRRPPRPRDENIVTKKRAFLMLAQGAFIAFCSLLAFIFVLYVEKEGIRRARTAAFTVLALSQLFHSFNCRSQTESIFKVGIFTNKNLVFAFGVSFALQMAAVYTPFFQTVFKTMPLGVIDYAVVIAVSSFPLWAMEGVKLLNKRLKFI
jgi:P-type Ca2+ transporter type 2C